MYTHVSFYSNFHKTYIIDYKDLKILTKAFKIMTLTPISAFQIILWSI